MRFGPGVHFSASDVRNTERERRYWRGRKRKCGCVRVCVRTRWREKERDIWRARGLSFHTEGQLAVLAANCPSVTKGLPAVRSLQRP